MTDQSRLLIKSDLFGALPGVEMPFAQVLPSLSQMWNVERKEGQGAPSEYRACQLNLVVGNNA